MRFEINLDPWIVDDCGLTLSHLAKMLAFLFIYFILLKLNKIFEQEFQSPFPGLCSLWYLARVRYGHEKRISSSGLNPERAAVCSLARLILRSMSLLPRCKKM